MSSTETRKDWEVVQEDLGKSKTDRLVVKGGHLVRTIVYGSNGEPTGTALVFVPAAG